MYNAAMSMTPEESSPVLKENVLANTAMLAHLKIRVPGFRLKDDEVTDTVNTTYGTDNSAGSYTKIKIDKKFTKDLQSAIREARNFHKEQTLPFTDGERLLPSKNYMEYTTGMRNLKNDFLSKQSEFKANYQTAIDEAKERLGTMFNENDYVDQQSLDDLFEFDIDIKPVPTSSQFTIKDLMTTELNMIKSDIEMKNRKFQEKAIKDLWYRLYNVVEHMQNRLKDPETKHFRSSLVTNIEDVIALLPQLNFMNDPELTKMANNVKQKICTIDPKELHKNDELRAETAQSTQEILDNMKSYIGKVE